jgi:YVTN family beta-propeller protein
MIRLLPALCLAALPLGAAAGEATPFAAFDAASEPVLANPHDLALGPDGRLYVSDVGNNRVAVLDPGTLAVVGEIGALDLLSPHDVAFDSAGRMLVADTGNDRIAIFEGGEIVGKLTGGINRPEGVAVHPNGRVYATGAWSGSIVAFADGRPVASAGGLSAPHDVAIDAAGNLWVADAGNDRMVLFSPELEVLAVLDGPDYGWSGPRYLDIDAGGNLVVADKYSHKIKKIAPDGSIAGVIGSEAGLGPNRFRTPEGVEIRDGTLFFSDSGNDRIVRYQVVTN